MNTCTMDAIRSKAEHGIAGNQDCRDLLKYIDASIPVDFSVDVLEGIQQTISDHLDNTISATIETIVRDYLEDSLSTHDIQKAIESAVRNA